MRNKRLSRAQQDGLKVLEVGSWFSCILGVMASIALEFLFDFDTLLGLGFMFCATCLIWLIGTLISALPLLVSSAIRFMLERK